MPDQVQRYLAHISKDGTREQSVKEHLLGTAKLAAEFARPFGGQEQARLAGELHDIGKYSDAFQRRIRGMSVKVDHSTAGARVAFDMRQLDVAFAVAGHHGGLPDIGSKTDNADRSTLIGRMHRQLEPYCAWEKEVELHSVCTQPRARDAFGLAFYTRMLFSCLVDADYLDTEAFMSGAPRRGGYAELPELLNRLQRHICSWMHPKNALNARRTDILRACLNAGLSDEPGLRTLTVPTGGGKTVSSLAYALTHAVAHGMARVIYVIPYTSIIDQTAEVFRDILGADNVIEHHSGLDYSADESSTDAQTYRNLLATENWDAPVIVTTAVQFFESLFASRPARCRKLHNIANSVVIFDEAQTLPIDYLKPCVAAIGELVRNYGVTAVLCTATQPELGAMFYELAGGLQPREICPGYARQYAFFRRNTLRFAGTMSTSELIAGLSRGEQVLCVVNKRATARALYEELPDEGRYCLTTLLCPVDRRKLLAEIRARLHNGLPCRVVATSLIEAGVDVDFPCAWREEAGLDSILQTAGRCNREGRRDASESIVTVFRLEGQTPPRNMRKNIDAARAVLDCSDDPAAPEAISRYFELYYSIKGERAIDKNRILNMFEKQRYPFESVANSFALIETQTVTLYIPVGDGAELVERLREGRVDRELFRRLGQYAVNVYPDQLEALDVYEVLAAPMGRKRRDAQGHTGTMGQYVLNNMNSYDRRIGLKLEDTGNGIFI